MVRKGLMNGPPSNIHDLEDPCPIFLLTKATKISRGPTTDFSKFPPGFMLQLDFAVFNAEIIRGFTSTFVTICYTISYPFGFTSIIKSPSLDIIKLLVTTLSNPDKKFALSDWMKMDNWQDLLNI